MTRILHVGCGRKQVSAADLFASVGLSPMDPHEATVTHLDADAALKPDIVCRLGTGAIPLPDDSVDMIVAWHILEHIGKQGEAAEWFQAWEELYRVLVPNGWIYAESPYHDSVWAWGDPTHTRAISEHAFVFFNQDSYRIPGNMISPYRVACDFQWMGLSGLRKGWAVIQDERDPQVRSLRFAVAARKPLRPWWED